MMALAPVTHLHDFRVRMHRYMTDTDVMGNVAGWFAMTDATIMCVAPARPPHPPRICMFGKAGGLVVMMAIGLHDFVFAET